MENVDLSLGLSESELVVSCIVGDDGVLLVVLESLAVGDMGIDGWLLASWSAVDGKSFMAVRCTRNCFMLGCGIKMVLE